MSTSLSTSLYEKPIREHLLRQSFVTDVAYLGENVWYVAQASGERNSLIRRMTVKSGTVVAEEIIRHCTDGVECSIADLRRCTEQHVPYELDSYEGHIMFDAAFG